MKNSEERSRSTPHGKMEEKFWWTTFGSEGTCRALVGDAVGMDWGEYHLSGEKILSYSMFEVVETWVKGTKRKIKIKNSCEGKI